VAQLVRQLIRQQAVELQAREHIEQELEGARLIQRQFLPPGAARLSGWEQEDDIPLVTVQRIARPAHAGDGHRSAGKTAVGDISYPNGVTT
jgi:hypothetical protein